ncbi:hypothetical protein [Flavobacterium lacus]|uniref:Uncharacterized protein n=1 Tax=Flavobacterium lacus TaxID=1353778 RepID=A0A328WSY7_9FLAO|nr:hypothetical protein [Flavobacterium lacus]RAR46498.1 hypothetical protein B0I10_11833 [Flavobacterium lacus]
MEKVRYLLEKNDDTSSDYFVKIQVADYNELFFTIADLLKVILMVMESEENNASKYVIDPKTNLKTLVEIVLQLLPFYEATILDEVILKKEKKL